MNQINFFKYGFIWIVFSFLIVGCAQRKNGFTAVSNSKTLDTKGISSVSAQESKSQFIFIKAEGYYVIEEYDKALILFSEVAENHPELGAVYYKMAQCYDKKNQLSSAILKANLAVEKNGKSEPYALYLIDLYMRTNNFQNAIYSYQHLIDKTKEDKYYLFQAEVFNQMARNESYKRDLLLNKSDEKSILDRKDAEQKIIKYYLSAIDALDKHEESLGKREDVISNKQQIYLFLGDYKNAKLEGEKLMSLMPKSMTYKFSHADVIAKADGLNDAIAYMRKVVNENPSSATSRLVLAEFYKRNNQYIFFQKELDAAFSLPEVDLDQKVKLINQMLTQSLNTDSRKTALDLAKKVVESHPTAPQSHSILGDAYLVNGEYENARNQFSKVLNLDKTKAEIWVQTVKLDAQLSQIDSLEKHAEEGIIHFPEEYSLYLFLADALIQKEEIQKAKKVLENGRQSAEGKPSFENEFNVRLGDVYFQLKDYVNCFSVYEEVLAYDPNNALIVNNYSYYLTEGNGDL